MPKVVTPSRSAAIARKHKPLVDDIVSAGHLRTNSSKRKSHLNGDGEEADHYVDAKASRKILQIGQALAEEEAAEQRVATQKNDEQINSAFDFSSRFDNGDQISDEEKFADDQWGDEEVEEAVGTFPSSFFTARRRTNLASGNRSK
jgi:essential nuclear protein 1